MCSPSGLKLSVSSAATTLNYTVLKDLGFSESQQFLKYEIIGQSTGVQICTKGATSMPIIEQMFGSVSELIVQEYCTDTMGCGGVYSTSFGDRVRLQLLSPSPAGKPFKIKLLVCF